MNHKTRQLQQTGIFALLSLVAAGFNYLFYPLAARLSEPVFFGNLNSLMSVVLQGSALLLSLNVISLYFLNNFDKETANRNIARLQSLSSLIIGAFLVACLILSPWTSSLLGSNDFWSLAIVYLSIILMIPAVIWSTYLQSHQQMYAVATYNIIASSLRLVFTCLALYFHQPLFVVMLLVLLSQLVGLAYLYVIAKHKPPILSPKMLLQSLSSKGAEKTRSFVSYVLFSTIALFAIGFITSYDVITVRLLFGEEAAGHYSGNAIFGKVIYFAAATIIWFVMPRVKLSDPQQSRAALAYLVKFMVSVGGTLILLFAVLGSAFIPLILGKDYPLDLPLLIVIGVEQLLVSLLMGYVMYLLVQRKGRALLLIAACIAAIICLLLVLHSSPIEVVLSYLFGTSIGMLLYIGTQALISRSKA